MSVTIEEAFHEGLRQVREAMSERGLPPERGIKGTDIPLLAAYTVFNARAKGKETHPDFPAQGPLYAKRLILDAYARS